jgi:diguanylate cyclase (GGDEF)-like protein
MATNDRQVDAAIGQMVEAVQHGDAGSVTQIEATSVRPAIEQMRTLIDRERAEHSAAARAGLAHASAADASLGSVAVIIAGLSAVLVGVLLVMLRLHRRLGQAQQRQIDWLRTAALHDSLTGLGNHRGYQEQVRSLAAGAEHCHLLMVDVNELKETNDSLGHQAGDELLVKVAAALTDASRQAAGCCYRVGGDEFALIAPAAQIASDALAAAVHARLADQPVPAPKVSIGVATSDGRIGADEWVRRADLALISAKQVGAPTLQYARRLEAAASADQVEQAELRALLADPSQVSAVFQPIVDLRTHEIVGYEALARFAVDAGHTTQEWFDMAHRHGLATELETVAVAAALAVPDRPESTTLALNISPMVLLNGRAQLGLPDDLSGLTVEVTEDALVTEGSDLELALLDLRSRGARIAVDDVGAGYAGFAQLIRIRPDVIKLDRSLIRDVNTNPTKAAVIEAFVQYAQRTGALICAEGIETASELHVVTQLGAAIGQGYHLARPQAPWAGLSIPPAGGADNVTPIRSDVHLNRRAS